MRCERNTQSLGSDTNLLRFMLDSQRNNFTNFRKLSNRNFESAQEQKRIEERKKQHKRFDYPVQQDRYDQVYVWGRISSAIH